MMLLATCPTGRGQGHAELHTKKLKRPHVNEALYQKK